MASAACGQENWLWDESPCREAHAVASAAHAQVGEGGGETGERGGGHLFLSLLLQEIPDYRPGGGKEKKGWVNQSLEYNIF